MITYKFGSAFSLPVIFYHGDPSKQGADILLFQKYWIKFSVSHKARTRNLSYYPLGLCNQVMVKNRISLWVKIVLHLLIHCLHLFRIYHQDNFYSFIVKSIFGKPNLTQRELECYSSAATHLSHIKKEPVFRAFDRADTNRAVVKEDGQTLEISVLARRETVLCNKDTA